MPHIMAHASVLFVADPGLADGLHEAHLSAKRMNKPTRVVIISLAAFVGVVVVVLAILPLFFEDRAVEAVRRAVNERLNAEVGGTTL